MITIIHGDDISASRSFLSTLKGQSTSPIELVFPIDLTDLTQILEGGGLFEDPKFLIIEQLLTNKKGSNVKDIVSLLIKHSESHSIVLWENKELTKPTLLKFPKATVRQFKLPQTLFQLLDAVRPGNSTQLVKLYQETSTRVADELIFFMLVRQFRLMLAVKTGAAISEIRSVSWQMSKLSSQANHFSLSKLKMLHKELHHIELATRTGMSSLPLSMRIDFFLLKI